MELPIDHFRLLGVSPSSNAEEVLRTFQLRLDRPPQKGFTYDVLAQRSELLRLSADLLSDNAQRKSYEVALLEGASGLDLSSNREVAGLLLLWEAKASYQSFKLAKKALQPPQTPALGSGRESDLTLIAALSCRDASIAEQAARRYASGADLLQEGIQLLQRMGKLAEERKILEADLEALLPYRILDLISRDIGDDQSHQDGLKLLDEFVLKRGGLEGEKKSEKIGGLNQSDFELFFLQIRKFLTANEQSKLFINWYRRGSEDAGFLAAFALIASGFSYRKPQLLQEARKFLRNVNINAFDPMPLIGCLDLLLADVEQAEARFRSSSDEKLKDWLDNYPGETLGALCDYCCNWLRKDVLIGFRDIEMKEVNLDDWFAHKEVQEYVENLETKSGALGIAKAGFSFFSSRSSEKPSEKTSTIKDESEGSLPMPGGSLDELSINQLSKIKLNNKDALLKFALLERITSLISSNFEKIKKLELLALISRRPLFASTFAFVGLFVIGTSLGILTQRKPSNENIISQSELRKNQDNKIDKLSNNISKSKVEKVVPLIEANPSKEQIEMLIKSWLKGKSDVLNGLENDFLSIVAKPSLYNRVKEERQKDLILGEKQIINASIISINIGKRSERRIVADVELNYKDKRVSASGKVSSETVIPSLKVKYVIGRNKNIWQLVDYISGS